MKSRVLATTLAVAGFISLCGRDGASVALATDSVTVYIEAEVYEVVDTLGLVTGLVDVGSTITGSYTVDPNMPDENAEPNVGTYRQTSGPYGIDLEVGGLRFRNDPDDFDFFIAVINGASDFFLLQSLGPNAFDVTVSPTATERISWQMESDSALDDRSTHSVDFSLR